jgi:hypothetical protein
VYGPRRAADAASGEEVTEWAIVDRNRHDLAVAASHRVILDTSTPKLDAVHTAKVSALRAAH